ncbi:MAG TPA: 2OG-Fe(II) oxygenase [Edaphobacter sp.]
MLHTDTIIERIAQLDWDRINSELNEQGYAATGPLLMPDECARLIRGYNETANFRSRVVMSRHGFGRGEYQYYGYPLPEIIQSLRDALYPHLALTANHWNQALKIGQKFPDDHAAFLRLCHQRGQERPTPLLLKYGAGDYNCLHQDLYGDLFFPLQAAFLLSNPGDDFTGGEFVLTEQRPRMQSRVSVVPLQQGEAVIFAVNHRPQQGSRGTYRVAMRHGVSPIHSGQRFTLGVIFHDAR